MLQLTNNNYYSLEADREYMSNSQYKDFLTCEAMAVAKLSGEWSEPGSDAMLVGSYVHAWLDGTIDQFKTQHHDDIHTKKGEPRSEFKQADKMIETLQNDPFCMYVFQGQHEVIVTAEFAGSFWKAKMDVYNPDPDHERIVDLKTVAKIRDKHWSKEYGYYVPFVQAFGYTRQMSLYSELERKWSGRDYRLEPLIVAVSKEDPPDKAIISLDEDIIRYELDEIHWKMERILQVKAGLTPPDRCETCRYCRETKKLSKVIHYSDLLA